MNLSDILSRVDHTLLKPEATWEDIRAICDDGRAFHTASVCIPPSYVKKAAEHLNGALPVCTVIGFPNGYDTSAVKALAAAEAVQNGAAEVDMVIDIGALRDKRYDHVLSDIRAVREAVPAAVLKVIIETCLLTEQEKIEMCRIVSDSGADFIKTSTGFSTGGATFGDVALMKKHCAPHLKIKAAGGISSLADAERFIQLGADRLGTSRIVKIAKESGAFLE